MKRLIIVGLLFLCCSLSLYAQEESGSLPPGVTEAPPSKQQWIGFQLAYLQLRQSFQDLARSSQIREKLLQDLLKSEAVLKSSNEQMETRLSLALMQLSSSTESLQSLQDQVAGKVILTPLEAVAWGVGIAGLAVLLTLILR